MGRRTVLLVVLTLVLLAGAGTVADAQGYGGDASMTCDPPALAPGDTVGLVVEGAPPGAEVTFAHNPVLGTAVADETGKASLQATIPDDVAPGPLTITASWSDDGLAVTAVCSVAVSSAAAAQVQGAVVSQGGESLPATGSDSAVPIAQVGIALVVAGAVFALIARKRTSSGASETVS